MTSDASAPALSLVMPAFNEEDVIADTVDDLFRAFAARGHGLQVVAVDNGSTDGTSRILHEMRETRPGLTVHRVEENQGYGHGLLAGLPLAEHEWVGIICADGQVEADDVAKLFDIAARAKKPQLLKVRRRFRMDGVKRKLTSVVYNLVTTVMFGGVGSIDVNGNPKIFPRDHLDAMRLESKDWFLDAEIMIKAKRLRLPVFEMNVFAKMREGGTSNVRPSTCLEFVRNLLRYRFGGGRVGALEPEAGAVAHAGTD